MKEIQAKNTIVDTSLRETKKHGTEDFPLGIYFDDFSDFEKGFISWHWHEEIQITAIIEGDFICRVEKNEIMLKPGNIIFMNGGRLHRIDPVLKSTGKLYSFIFRGELIGGMGNSRIYRECVDTVIRKGASFYLFPDMESDALYLTLQKIIHLYTGNNPYDSMRIHLLLSQIWMSLMEQIPYEDEKVLPELKRDDTRIKLALSFLQDHYNEDITLEDIAREAMIGRSELCRCFQRTLGTSPREYLIRYRVRQASVLLKNSDYQIAEIAEMTGFSSPSHFGSYFHKIMGCTPREYRKL